jgi:hypothetical protein
MHGMYLPARRVWCDIPISICATDSVVRLIATGFYDKDASTIASVFTGAHLEIYAIHPPSRPTPPGGRHEYHMALLAD